LDEADKNETPQSPLVIEPHAVLCVACGAEIFVGDDVEDIRCSECGEAPEIDVADMVCWTSSMRTCSSACVAWDERAQGDEKYSSCMVLNLARALTGHLGAIKRISDAAESRAVDKYRADVPGTKEPPPEVSL